MAYEIEVLTMRAMEQLASGADGPPLDAWLRQALRQAFGGALIEPLPSDLLALAAGQPQACSMHMVGRSERRHGRLIEARNGQ